MRRRISPPPPQPLLGWTENRSPIPLLELLDDDQLAALNALLPWRAFTVDSKGRRFGNRLGAGGKKERPEQVPDRRIILMDQWLGLRGKHVLEVGCFEGIHTAGLCQLAGQVTAVDARLENVVKTIVRCAFYDQRPRAFVCELESWHDDDALQCDFVHHVGVLYHLRDPVTHIARLGALAREGVFLDTQVAEEGEAVQSMEIDGRTFRYKRFDEPQGKRFIGAGMYDHSRWLLLDDLESLLREAGFMDVRVLDRRPERQGTRVTVVARRSSSKGPAWPSEPASGQPSSSLDPRK